MNAVRTPTPRSAGFSIGLAIAGPAAALTLLLTAAATSVVMAMM